MSTTDDTGKPKRRSGPRLPGFAYDARKKLARFDCYVPGTHGKERRRGCAKNVTKDEALTKWKEFRQTIAAPPAPPAPAPETFAAYVARVWLQVAARVSKRTAAVETSVVNRKLVPFFGGYRLEEINAAVVRDFVGRMKQDGYAVRGQLDAQGEPIRRPYSPAVINGALAVLRKILRDAVEREELDAYPIRSRLPRVKEEPLRLELSEEERLLFLAAFEDARAFRSLIAEERSRGTVATSPHFGGPRVFGGGPLPDGEIVREHFARFRASRPLFIVALEAGLSRGDLLGLPWQAVDLELGLIRQSRGKTKVEAQIPISAACRAALLVCRRRGAVDRIVPADELVFLTPEGKPYTVERVTRYFVLAKKLGSITRRFRFHDLRHTFASRLASAGVSLQVIAKALGHTSARMSERYARPSDEAMFSILRALDAPLDTSLDTSARAKRRASAGLRPSHGVVMGSVERVMGLEPTTSSLGS
jgi:integrase